MHVAITGGTGFVGRALCRALDKQGHQWTVLSRKMGGEGVVGVDYEDEDALCAALQGKDAVIHLVGVLHAGRKLFAQVHHQLPLRVLRQAKRAGIDDFLHMSALGADPAGPSAYLQSKYAGERAVFDEAGRLGMRAVAMRPSVIFGEDEGFFHLFARYLKWLPLMPLPCGQARFQPVAVEDVAAAFVWALESSVDQAAFELGGPEVMTLREVIDRLCLANGWKRWIINVPDMAAKWQGRLGDWLPGMPFTYDNYLSMQRPSVCDSNPWAQMGIVPRQAVMPIIR